MTQQSTSWDGTERRTRAERRTQDRHGKYDRRRNRCGHCRFFTISPEQPTTEGFCQQHQTPYTADHFACPLFEDQPGKG